MRRKLKVLIVSSIFPNHKEPTKGIYIFNQIKALSTYCKVKVLAPIPYFPVWIRSDVYGLYSRVKKKEKIDGLDVMHPRVLVIPKIGRSLYGFLHILSLYNPLKKEVLNFMPDVIVGYWAYPDGFATVALSKVLRIPVILGGRGCDINNARDLITKRMMVSWALRKCQSALAVSQDMKRVMVELGADKEKVCVIPNGVHEMFVPMNKKEARAISGIGKNAQNNGVILYCGRLSEEKGLRYMIEAAKILNEDNVPFCLYLVGDGPLKAKLEDLSISLNLQDRIYFKQPVPYHEMPAVMSSCDVFCLSSIREGCPNVVMEALACGVPVVASKVGGVPEILKSESYGIMVPKENPTALANGLKRALNKEWNSSIIRRSVCSRTWDQVGQEIFDEIKGVLSKWSSIS